MKRYNLAWTSDNFAEMLEDPEGEFVRAVDAQFAIDRLEEQIEKLENQLIDWESQP